MNQRGSLFFQSISHLPVLPYDILPASSSSSSADNPAVIIDLQSLKGIWKCYYILLWLIADKCLLFFYRLSEAKMKIDNYILPTIIYELKFNNLRSIRPN